MVRDINLEVKYFLSVDMERGYCKMVVNEEVQERLVLLPPDGKRRFKLITMGSLNESPTFVAMTTNLQKNGIH